jgi:hypothetical protein
MPGKLRERCVEGEDTVKIRVRVGPSRIAGKGLFAGQEIKQGIKITGVWRIL